MLIPIKERSIYRKAKIDTKGIATELSEREKRAIRKKWKSQKRTDRSREKEVKDILNIIHNPPPPSSPEHESAEIHITKEEKTTRGIKIIQTKAKDAARNKYHLKTETYKSIGYHCLKKNKVKQQKLTKRISGKVHAFYIRNDNSRLKDKTKTLKTIRKQKRVLLFDIKTLHKNFLSEAKTKNSYNSDLSLLFFLDIVIETHVCVGCNNTKLMAVPLKRVSSIESADTCLGKIICSTNEKDCMYSECKACKERSMDANKDVLGDDVQWFEWNTKREVRTIKKGKNVTEKAIHITEKEMKNGNVNESVDKFVDHLKDAQNISFELTINISILPKRRMK
ncbi:hypothetical protein MAR_005624 [Mya arenaria]|uniref:Uncharacterized protein n=1 Tax=Mya arenaria TaxID=6604 RepID=A0ABY7F2W0_MYAAR|nr:hypothetical protein MAR_005624 [Mya arenaria]